MHRPEPADPDRPKHPSAAPEPDKDAPVRPMTQEEHKRHVERGLISKAYTIFGWTLFLLFAVFLIGFFFDGEESFAGEFMRMLFSILTFLLGYLFATIRN